ncbi:MAG: NADH:ubiquinone reductase (Na(+)-transporting) subunit B [Porphyromonadaceae bacterium]|uniref:Na(+)-translocating NADH-quinone reductase subunit B n=1 Tax=Porphyromonas pasteri TaxID=1583331 RepID=A0ABQ2H8K7_9PORP|nr:MULTISPECIES: NADH:ubiquinone reductase (Na(+)-transporting) subunit B [Porphyromonas]MBF1267772.1 NADH:ubiquinone reductase (Na(+)-transporting) subunit B [Porphyromonadaceae bacterium]MBF1275176.1 NADH:ubiquinone reductase (Na(+)-transporting) subunit B [Porphyromonadaceae bacterium]MBF1308723.1 NADH:ubiquinone reductase (Na(+)-transporting) subunit B [Porphyromonadaceae bacterium]MBF1312459.1 NADH:ubiquinone reductase (Na(+)-transporting) subunit B [Porphyromonadaceae bacterium]MBF131597
MNALRKQIDKIKPAFTKGGRFSALESVFDGFETFLFVPNTTSKRRGAHVHDAIDSKRTMSVVIFALLPALLFGMYNVGLQHNIAVGVEASFWSTFFYGFLSVLPQIIVSYAVGLGIEFIIAQMKHEEIQEGFLVTGILIPMIIPVETPLWMIAVATAFAVVFAKEVFGGTGYNVFNVALITRAFLFFSYPAAMSGDSVWVRLGSTFGLGGAEKAVDGFSGATPLGQIAAAKGMLPDIHNTLGGPLTDWDAFLGFLPGSVGEVSTLAILIGACILIYTGIASYKIMVSGVVGVFAMAAVFNAIGATPAMQVSALHHLIYGGFAFGIVFMATDPVTAARTEAGKWVYGFLIGVMVVFIRVLNAGYAEGMMLAILLMNTFAPLIDYIVVERNTQKRLKRLSAKAQN